MVFAGILPWTFFSTGLSEASNSMVSNLNPISNVHFPRMIVTNASVIVALADFLIGFGYRDFRRPVPFMVQFGLYVSPVGFSTSVVP
jgi:lipopolysaccharide transport system permease protein